MILLVLPLIENKQLPIRWRKKKGTRRMEFTARKNKQAVNRVSKKTTDFDPVANKSLLWFIQVRAIAFRISRIL